MARVIYTLITLILLFVPKQGYSQADTIIFNFNKFDYKRLALDSVNKRYDYTIKLVEKIKPSNKEWTFPLTMKESYASKDELQIITVPIFLASQEIKNYTCKDNILKYINFDNVPFLQVVYVFDINGHFIDKFTLPVPWFDTDRPSYLSENNKEIIYNEYIDEGYYSIPKEINPSWFFRNDRILHYLKFEPLSDVEYYKFIFQHRDRFMFYSIYGLYIYENKQVKIYASSFNPRENQLIFGPGNKKYKTKLFEPNMYIKKRYSIDDIRNLSTTPVNTNNSKRCICLKKEIRTVFELTTQ